MARWRLMVPHYLNVPGTVWEHKEVTNQGRQIRKDFPVPTYLDPDDVSVHNFPGEIIVCHEGKGNPKDYIFTGPPTPEMAPVDDEAEKITAEWQKKWQHPIDSLSAGFGDALLNRLEAQLAEAVNRNGGNPVAVSKSGVTREEFAALQQKIVELMDQNAKLLAAQSAPERRAI